MSKSLSGSIALTKLTHVLMTKKGKDNKDVKGIFIPCEINHLVEGKEGAYYMPVKIFLRDEPDQYDQNGFISQSVDSKVYKAASDEQKEAFKKLPILGNVKDWSQGGDDASGAASATVVSADDDGDDLPF